MVTILHADNIQEFHSRFCSSQAILIPIFADPSTHPCNNKLSVLYVKFLDNNDSFVLPIDHSEALPVSIDELRTDTVKYVPNRKEIRHVLRLSNLIDVNLLQYVQTGEPISFALEDTKAHTVVKRNFPNHLRLNRVIPLSKHIEACEVLSSKIQTTIRNYDANLNEPAFQFLNFNTTDVFQQIESSGIHVDSNIFGPEFKRHISSNLAYSEYNFFTSTGRPSNRFGGVNFAALNKEDGTRSVFTSRFEDGMMVLFDYDAYHLRLIADLIGFSLPDGNIHDYLGRIYFKTDTLTDEQYNESKRISFHLLYGGITDEYREVPFFVAIQKFIDWLWSFYEQHGYIVSPIGQRKLYQSNMRGTHPQKLFNYFIQLHETEHNVMTLEKVLPLFDGRESKLVLYTYDSILIDFSPNDKVEFIKKVKTELECENTYPVKVYVGHSYHELVNVTKSFHT